MGTAKAAHWWGHVFGIMRGSCQVQSHARTHTTRAHTHTFTIIFFQIDGKAQVYACAASARGAQPNALYELLCQICQYN